MKHIPMRPGIPALILLVITICLTVMSALTLSTAQAELRLARRHAEVTASQYACEAAGQEFLSQVDKALQAGKPSSLEGVTMRGDVCVRTIEVDGTTLTIELIFTDDGHYEIVGWQMNAPSAGDRFIEENDPQINQGKDL